MAMLNPSDLPDVKADNSLQLLEEGVQKNNNNDNISISGSIWTISNGTKNPSRLSTATLRDEKTPSEAKDGAESETESKSSDEDDDDESLPDTKIIFDKEFDDYYEDRIHKSGSSIVFLSKAMGLLPTIWTEEDLEGEFKTYLNFYTFVLYSCWVALFVITGIRLYNLEPSTGDPTFELFMNGTKDGSLLYSNTLLKASLISQWISALIIVSCGIFNSHVLAEILYTLAGIDSVLDLKEKQYTKINRKVIAWCIFYIILWAGHGIASYYLLYDSNKWHLLYFFSDLASYGIPVVMDVQFIFLSLSLRKRYRILSKILHGKTKAWKHHHSTLKNGNLLQNLLQYRFDQLFEPKEEELLKSSLSKPGITMDPWFKEEHQGKHPGEGGEVRASKEEEQELINQLDSLRCVYVDLGKVIEETNNMFSSSLFSHIVALNISFIIWLYLNMFSLEYFRIYIVYIIFSAMACLRTYLICNHAHKLKHEARKPVAEVCQISSMDGSAKLERLLVKTASQMYYNQPVLSCGDYFPLGQKSFFLTLTASIMIAYILYRIHGFEFNSLLEMAELKVLRSSLEDIKSGKTKS